MEPLGVVILVVTLLALFTLWLRRVNDRHYPSPRSGSRSKVSQSDSTLGTFGLGAASSGGWDGGSCGGGDGGCGGGF